MEYVEVRTQTELDKALEKPGVVPICQGNGYFEVRGSSQVRASGSSQVTAYDSSQVTASDSSQVTASGSSQVTASGSSQVTASDSSQVRAYDSSQVTASGSSQVTAYDSSQVRASKYVAVTREQGQKAKVMGGVLIEPPQVKTAEEWCDRYGVEVKRGVAILYKGLDDKFVSGHGMAYEPGSKPQAPDWDGGERECGGGLHFSPTPAHTLQFAPEAARFVGCPVRLKDVVVHESPMYPSKIKAKGCCGPVFEVDIHGNRLKTQVAA